MGRYQKWYQNSNLELRIKLTQEETITIRNKKKIHKLTNDLERCELYIKYLEKNLISRENEIDKLKAEYCSTLHNLKKYQDHLELKEEALVAQDNQIILLEDTIEKLKSQILKISHFQNNSNKPSEEEHQENMAIPDILRNVGTALDQVESYINGDTSFDPRNILNGIRISITTIREHMERHIQDAINLQGQLNTAYNLLNNANGQINNFINDMANVRNECLRRAQLLTLTYNNEANEHHRWWQIAQERQINAVAGFNAQARANKMIGKMTGRFHPVPVQNPYNGNNAINNEAEFLNWLQGKYQEVMVGTGRDTLRALGNERFTAMDTADTYEKRIKPYTLGIPYADVSPYLYEHMPQYMEMRLRQTAPANLDAFFRNLCTI
ncbi:hypothetical protein C1645_734109 [Glomus cerebriforme]|uniref:Uncharacterized protein n=1 Tax=Glomus cerebriforme TaxID=658196 RepID=A0A397TBX6_9GLOM|nr:hypothetical protein C1645_734109 [Glomus cerebriforme]